MISADLNGRTALVTGGASGIGLATVRQLSRNGARVAVNHLIGDAQALKEISDMKREGLDVLSAAGSVADPAECTAMVENALQNMGRLDFLINNAGTAATTEPIDFSDLNALSEELWQTILSTNLLGPFRCARAASQALKYSQGAIVNTASFAGLSARASSMAYAASKAALINMTRGLARALAPDVRVNAVAPAFVDTPWTKPWSEARKRVAIDRSFLARMATAEDIAETIFFLAAGAGYVNGQTIVLDGGSI